MLLNKHYEMEQFLEKIVRVFDLQNSKTLNNGKTLSEHSALTNYNDIAEDAKLFLMVEKLNNHRKYVSITSTVCDKSCWCWEMENNIAKLEEKHVHSL